MNSLFTGEFTAEGYGEGIQQIPSPNCDARPPGCVIELIVVHAISLPPGEFGGPGVIELFTNHLDPDDHPYYASIAQLHVSAHFFIRRDGATMQFVSCLQRAWHAGQSEWRGRSNCNDFSIGIELEGSDELPFEDAQYAALSQLIFSLQRIFPIQEVTGHSDIAPGRKTDPGPHFNWQRLGICK